MSSPKAPIRVFDTSLNQLVEVDTYQTAFFERKLSEYGEFSIQINWNIFDNMGNRLAAYFQRGNFVLFGSDLRKIGVITEVSKKVAESGKGSEVVTVKGRQAKYIFARRVVYPPTGYANYTHTAVAETVLKTLITNQCGSGASAARQISLVNVLATQGRGSSYTYSSRYKKLDEDLKTISTASGLGFELALNLTTKKLDFDVITGVDRRASQSVNDRMIISTDYDTLKTAQVIDSDVQYKNLVIAAGQGVGEDRNIRNVYSSTEPTGLDRREVFQDMRDLASTTDVDARGATVLAENSTTQYVDASVLSYSQYQLGVDYDLGDLVTLSAFDLSTDAQITGIKETWGPVKYDIALTFNRQYPEFPKKVSGNADNTTNVFNNTEPPQSGLTTAGRYIKFSDGTIIQYGEVVFTAGAWSGGPWSAFPFFKNSSATFPQNFLAGTKPAVTFSVLEDAPASGSFPGYYYNLSNTGFSFYIFNGVNNTTVVNSIRWQAIGRWK